MLTLTNALHAWKTPAFAAVLGQELAQQAERLPLLQGLTTGNYVADAPVTVTLISVAELDQTIRVRAGIFYQSIIGGCSCAGDPITSGENAEYCEVQADIDKASGIAAVALIAEQAD